MTKKPILVATLFLALVCEAYLLLGVTGAAATTANRLPSSFGDSGINVHHIGTRAWTIPDIIEVRRITGIAIAETTHQVAFIIEQSFVDSGQIRYGLYVIDRTRPHVARKVVEAPYLADLSWHPNTDLWTVRGDFGAGVQLYDIDPAGSHHPLVVSPDVALTGGYEIYNDSVGPQRTGILSYQWSPNGSALWYSRLRLYSRARQKAIADRGVAYDDRSMLFYAFTNNAPVTFAGTEFHVRNITPFTDRLVAFVPETPIYDSSLFRTDSYWPTSWTADGKHIQYPVLFLVKPKAAVDVGRSDAVRWEIDIPSGRTHVLAPTFGNEPHRISLRSSALAKTTNTLSDHCAFTRDMSFRVCVRESLTIAPELVAVSRNSRAVTTLVRPNMRYDAITPLHSVYTQWTNRYGSTNDGYVTYPRTYVAGHRYPVIVVTHAADAKNLFAWDGFQWEFPVQVLAERGYFVLSVNEPFPSTANFPASGGTLGATTMSVARQQFADNFNPVASMEAALQSAIDRGFADPAKTGIAGYSEGSHIAEYTMDGSTMFKVGSEGDAGGWESGAYWIAGNTAFHGIYQSLYGGSPFDSRALPNYQRFAPAFRADHFAGPFLQQYAAASGPVGLELHTALLDAGIPTEYVFYPHESHVFWDPRHRASAMQRNLDWFDYWLLDKRDNDPSKKEQYERWGAMKNAWKHDSQTAR